MSWTVYNSSGQLLQATDLPDNSVDSDQYVDGSIDTAHMAASQITNALMADDAIGVAELSATGTASSSTFLRGDNAWAAPAGGPSQATQSALEAETNQDTYAPPDLVKHSPGVAKAWCTFNGNAGSMANDAEYNCDTPTDNGTGDYTINWTINFSGIDYAVLGTNDHLHTRVEDGVADAAGASRIGTYNTQHDTRSNSSSIRVVAFGEQ